MTTSAGLNMYANTQSEMKKKSQRVPLHLVCQAGIAHEALAMRDGYIKYGYASYLNDGVKMTVTECLGAAQRHISRLLAGEDLAPDSKAHHAGHARAMLGIYLECLEAGKLIDDRHSLQKDKKYVGAMMDRLFAETQKNDNLDAAKAADAKVASEAISRAGDTLGRR